MIYLPAGRTTGSDRITQPPTQLCIASFTFSLLMCPSKANTENLCTFVSMAQFSNAGLYARLSTQNSKSNVQTIAPSLARVAFEGPLSQTGFLWFLWSPGSARVCGLRQRLPHKIASFSYQVVALQSVALEHLACKTHGNDVLRLPERLQRSISEFQRIEGFPDTRGGRSGRLYIRATHRCYFKGPRGTSLKGQ